MGLLGHLPPFSHIGRLWSRPRPARLLKAILVEQRRQGLALERIAAVLEREVLGHVQTVHPPVVQVKIDLHGQGGDQDGGGGSGVSYVDAQDQATYLAIEEELRSVMGRDPSERELERAFAERGVN